MFVFSGLRLPGLIASAGAFAVALTLGQWLKAENWIGVSSFLPVMLTAGMGIVTALSMIRGKAPVPHITRRASAVLLPLTGLLYGSSGLTVTMVLSRSEQYLAFLFSALGTLVGLVLVIMCAGQLYSLAAGAGEVALKRLRFRIAYLGGVVAFAIGLYHSTAPYFAGGVIPAVPLAALVGAVALGILCGAQPSPFRAYLPGLVGCSAVAGMAVSLRGASLPQTTMALYGSLVLTGVLLARPLQWPGWAVLLLLAASSMSIGAYAGFNLNKSVVIPEAQATSMTVLLVFLFLVAYFNSGHSSPEKPAVRLFGLMTVLLALTWRFAEYRDWLEGEVTIGATMGLVHLPVLTMILALAALLMWPRKRRFQPADRRRAPVHWVLVMVALFTLPVGGCAVRNPFYTLRAPTADEARSIMDMLLTDTYFAFNISDEEAAFDRLARNLSEELVPEVYLDSRRRLTAGTRKGAEVTVKDVSVMSVGAPGGLDPGETSFTYPCKWVVTARIRHWLHIHDRKNMYVGELTITVEDDRWKISHLELLSEEREILSWKKS
jgi:hydrogenase/urease accessory protein HupE